MEWNLMGKWCDAGSQSIKKCADYTTLYGFPTYVSRFCRHAMYHLSQTFFVIPQLLANPTKYKKIGSSHASMDLSVNPCYHHLRVAQHHGTGLNDLPFKRGTSSFPFDAPVIIAVFLNSKNAILYRNNAGLVIQGLNIWRNKPQLVGGFNPFEKY